MLMSRMALSQLPPGTGGVVKEMRCAPTLEMRLEDLGLTEGTEVRCLHKSPAGTPAAYEIRGAVIALRRGDAEQILVEAEP